MMSFMLGSSFLDQASRRGTGFAGPLAGGPLGG
jgi:hypothetical protein